MISRHTIPQRLNWLLLLLVFVLNTVLLYGASHGPWWLAVVSMLLFSLSNNTAFSLLHESVHGVFDAHVARNRCAGRLAAMWFPTGLAVQKVFHLNHHANNRSPSEQFDVLHQDDVRWLKYAQWYAIFSGLYWLVAVVAVLIYALMPRFVRRALLAVLGRQGRLQTGADSYVGALDKLGWSARWEVLAAWAWQLALVWLLDLTWLGWLGCYAAFALMWSSLQYTDHAFSVLDARQGAWNLKVPSWLRWVFLNYHLHLTHHQYPQLSWLYLPEYASQGPRFFEVWLACLKGPRAPNAFPRFQKVWPL